MKSTQPLIEADKLLRRGTEITIAAGQFQSESGLNHTVGAKVRNSTLQGMSATLDTLRIAHGERLFNLGNGVRVIIQKKLRHFFQEFPIATDTVQRQGQVQ